MACHLMALTGFLIPLGNILGPLQYALEAEESDFIDFHGKTALNYQLTLLVFLVGGTLLAAFTGFAVMFIAPVLGLCQSIPLS